MSTQTTPQTDRDLERRTALIEGLRQLSDWYEANPDVPVPTYPELSHSVLAADDAEGVAEVEAIGAAFGVDVKYGSHVTATRAFAGLSFKVAYVSRESAARWREHMATYGRDETPLSPVTVAEPTPDDSQAGV